MSTYIDIGFFTVNIMLCIVSEMPYLKWFEYSFKYLKLLVFLPHPNQPKRSYYTKATALGKASI